jgi:hypothetical protein
MSVSASTNQLISHPDLPAVLADLQRQELSKAKVFYEDVDPPAKPESKGMSAESTKLLSKGSKPATKSDGKRGASKNGTTDAGAKDKHENRVCCVFEL